MGFPSECQIYPGNRVDKTTVKDVLSELKAEYPIEDIIFVVIVAC